jgi:hypothetical protein
MGGSNTLWVILLVLLIICAVVWLMRSGVINL